MVEAPYAVSANSGKADLGYVRFRHPPTSCHIEMTVVLSQSVLQTVLPVLPQPQLKSNPAPHVFELIPLGRVRLVSQILLHPAGVWK